jgi:hypothetical protein
MFAPLGLKQASGTLAALAGTEAAAQQERILHGFALYEGPEEPFAGVISTKPAIFTAQPHMGASTNKVRCLR